MKNDPSSPTPILPRFPLFRLLARGACAGLLAGLLMLLVMVTLRSLCGVATPIEMIFDRLFPLLTVDFFIDSLVRAGGYTPLKLQGIFGALAGLLGVAAFGGAVYAWFVGRLSTERKSLWLVVPGVLAAWALFTGLLWPNLLTSYRGLPTASAMAVSSFAMLFDFAVCGLGVMLFYRLLTGSATAGPATRINHEVALAAPGLGRRAFVAGGIGAGLAIVTGGMLHRLYRIGTFFYDGRQYGGPDVQKITPIRPEDRFYQVSKNFVDPDVVRDTWRLEIVGQLKQPRTYTFAEIAALPAVIQETTLLCISYGVGSGLCSNAVWKGVPLRNILADAIPNSNVAAVLFHAADGYYEVFNFAKAMEATTLLAYEMNGEPLPEKHGFPLRMIVPGLYGEKNPKWLTRIELLDEHDPRLHARHGLGFYHEQGWGPVDVIPTHSRIDAPQVNGDHFEHAFTVGQPTELRGMAFGGDRGISRVELSFDNGSTWRAAEIHQPGTKISWSLWRFAWTPATASQDVRVVVRAFDADGLPQIAEDRPSVPHGATGLHRVRAEVAAA